MQGRLLAVQRTLTSQSSLQPDPVCGVRIQSQGAAAPGAHPHAAAVPSACVHPLTSELCNLCIPIPQHLGVDVDTLLLCQPDSGEMALEVADSLIRWARLGGFVRMCLRCSVAYGFELPTRLPLAACPLWTH